MVLDNVTDEVIHGEIETNNLVLQMIEKEAITQPNTAEVAAIITSEKQQMITQHEDAEFQQDNSMVEVSAWDDEDDVTVAETQLILQEPILKPVLMEDIAHIQQAWATRDGHATLEEDGQHISLWYDNWLGVTLVEALDIPIHMRHSLNAKVSDVIDHGNWDIPQFIMDYAPWLKEEILDINLPLVPTEDVYVWKHSKDGRYK
ncbi:unnamed protein product [Trifolium pratense]|uniref:Uncharacterized protein n=1 Tax=Trifolium pratense TaxID=57577 RepID=A0ACB0K3E4_TRIPR|nr:unnamed protein product [Trifolium pratense]